MPDPESDRDPEASGPDTPSKKEDDALRAGSASGEELSSSETGPVTVRLQTVANILTAAVALAAIVLSVWEGVENRRHNRLSVLPHLQLSQQTMASATPITNENFLLPSQADSLFAITYVMENTGLGPAVLQNIVVYEDGEEVFDAVQSEKRYYYPGKLKENLRRLPFPVGTLQQSLSTDQMVKAGDRFIMLTAYAPFAGIERDSLEGASASPLGMMQRRALAGRSVVVCYCSVYGENCDRAHFGERPPGEADACDF